jgi:hypothetical protein
MQSFACVHVNAAYHRHRGCLHVALGWKVNLRAEQNVPSINFCDADVKRSRASATCKPTNAPSGAPGTHSCCVLGR